METINIVLPLNYKSSFDEIIDKSRSPGSENAFSEQGLYGLLTNTTANAIIEIANINNREQMQYIEDDKKLDQLCSNILEAVFDFCR